MNWRLWLTVALLLGALVSGWSAWRQRADTGPAAAPSERSDYVLREFEMVSLNAEGTEAFTLRAPELARSPKDETMSLATPLFLLPDETGHHWTVRSKTGWISADHDELQLRGDVDVVSSPEGGRDVTMKTEQLNVFPRTRQAVGPGLVDIVQPGSTMQGTGMRADLNTRRIQFDSKVKTRYVPTGR